MHEIVTIRLSDAGYPKLLEQIPDPPETVYCRGNLDLLNSMCFAIVGTRKMTPYGRQTATAMARELVQNAFTIVSGLALGIDAIAHTAALDSDGSTIAVLAGGIDDAHIYPSLHRSLAQRILRSGGLLLSEYPSGTRPMKHMFPERNRIVSGVSLGVLVIEADEKSGALITARCALEQNRDVFAIPGNIFSPRSAGPHHLIQAGAKLVTQASDILSEYGAQISLLPRIAASVSTRDPIQKKILAILESNGPTLLDHIIRSSEQETSKIIAALSLLELNGKIAQSPPGTYHVCNS